MSPKAHQTSKYSPHLSKPENCQTRKQVKFAIKQVKSEGAQEGRSMLSDQG